MENYSKAVSEMYSQFKKDESPLAKYVGKFMDFNGVACEVIGYSAGDTLIINRGRDGWMHEIAAKNDIIFKDCKNCWYVSEKNFKEYTKPKKEAHSMGEYIGRLANIYGEKLEVVGYSLPIWTAEPLLIVDCSEIGGWTELGPRDVIFKECKGYWYVRISNLTE